MARAGTDQLTADRSCSKIICLDPETLCYLHCAPTRPTLPGPDPTRCVTTMSALRLDIRAHCDLARIYL